MEFFWRLHLTARSRETHTQVHTHTRDVRVHRKGELARERIRARKRKGEMVRVVGSAF